MDINIEIKGDRPHHDPIPGVKIVWSKKSQKFYYYDQATNKPITGSPDTWEFRAAMKTAASTTVKEMIDQYRLSTDYRKLKSSSKITKDRELMLIEERFGERPIDSVTRSDINQVYDIELGDRPGRMVSFLAAAKAVWNHAIVNEKTIINPCNTFKRPNLGSLKAWPEHLIQPALDSLPEHMRDMCVLALYTGQRYSDLRAMLWTDFDPKARTIKVVQEKLFKEGEDEGDKVLEIPCHDKLYSYLMKMPRKGPYICMTSTCKQWPQNGQFAGNLNRLFSKTAMKGYSIHGLRKTAAKRLADVGCSAHQIMSITGHSTLAEVQRYTRGFSQKKASQEAMSMLQGKQHQDIVEALPKNLFERKAALLALLAEVESAEAEQGEYEVPLETVRELI
jgi:integrase